MYKSNIKDLKDSLNNRALLIVIALVLIGIFTIMVLEAGKKTPGEKMEDSFNEIIDSAGDSFEELGDEVERKIDQAN